MQCTGTDVIVLNYAHPLTSEQLAQLTAQVGALPDMRDIAVHIDRDHPIAEVARDLADAAGLAPALANRLALIVNPPGLAPLALALIAENHGRSGHFPAIVNIRPIDGSLSTQYEVQEIVNLQKLRDDARTQR
jgi:hypothetical protein